MEAAHSTYTSDAMVENLPPEVRHEILTTLDLTSLRNVVHASPVFYRQYVLKRRSVLSRCLERTLGRTLLDAYWVYQTARSSKFPSITNDETIPNFRQAYMHQQVSGSYSVLRKSVTENLAIGIAAFHYSTVEPIMQFYIRHVLEILDKQTGGIVGQEPLSQVEQARLIRGLYRFQLCCNLFNMANFPVSSTLSRKERTMRILTDYISLLEPWEIEEMGCIYLFANIQFGRISTVIWRCATSDSAKTMPRKVLDPEDGNNLGDTALRTTLLKSTISQGLPILHTILTTNGEVLPALVGSSVAWFEGSFLEDPILSKAAQKRRHREEAAQKRRHREEAASRKQWGIMPFQGGKELCPPLAWTILWNNSTSKLYGDYIPDELRHWGYVMWDAARLETSGATCLLKTQWKEMWAGYDPRNEMRD
ncbi:hypothetical protein LCI18_011471 [Fusarium solani-melongenae]|uniref:Uncharacterized protein n=1 Tax=Fusarium solani subsp. cucurbitae TaxID=2747967 RepID=A0ACD3ZI61_FUSSC|nr:hypothetical protein LCI18_011471 [Fusarium solani-melongenae]